LSIQAAEQNKREQNKKLHEMKKNIKAKVGLSRACTAENTMPTEGGKCGERLLVLEVPHSFGLQLTHQVVHGCGTGGR
jgi:hypothetical protein